MKLFASALAVAALVAGAASAQAPAPMAKPAPAAHAASAMTTPTKTAPHATTVSKTTVKGGPVTRTAASLECSKQADAQNLHGKARKKMMSTCKSAAKKA